VKDLQNTDANAYESVRGYRIRRPATSIGEQRKARAGNTCPDGRRLFQQSTELRNYRVSSLDVKAGQRVGIVGSSDAGKTIIINMRMRL